MTLPEALNEIDRLKGVIARNNAKAGAMRDEVIRLRAENKVLRERTTGAADPFADFVRGLGRRPGAP